VDGWADVVQQVSRQRAAPGWNLLVVALSPTSLLLFADDSKPTHVASEVRIICDVTGGANTMLAVLALALGAALERVIGAVPPNAAPGLCVARTGTSCVGTSELKGYLQVLGDLLAGENSPTQTTFTEPERASAAFLKSTVNSHPGDRHLRQRAGR